MDIPEAIPHDQHDIEMRMTYQNGWGDGYIMGYRTGLRVASETITNLQREKP